MPPRKHMRDACKIGARDAVTSGPRPTQTWTYGSAIRCRFVRNEATREVMDGTEVASTDVAFHLPADTTVSANGRIQLTERNNAALGTPEYFKVIGEPFFPNGNRTVVVNCQSVPAGAV